MLKSPPEGRYVQVLVFLRQGLIGFEGFRAPERLCTGLKKVRLPAVDELFTNAVLTSQFGDTVVTSERCQNDRLLLLGRPGFALLPHEFLPDNHHLFSAHHGRIFQGISH